MGAPLVATMPVAVLEAEAVGALIAMHRSTMKIIWGIQSQNRLCTALMPQRGAAERMCVIMPRTLMKVMATRFSQNQSTRLMTGL